MFLILAIRYPVTMTDIQVGEPGENLISFLRQAIPNPGAISKLNFNQAAGYVTFSWFGREFLVNKSKQVFELKGQKIFITGYSMLMQSALSGPESIQNRVKRIMEALAEVEDLIRMKHRVETGLTQLNMVKRRILELVPNQPRRFELRYSRPEPEVAAGALTSDQLQMVS